MGVEAGAMRPASRGWRRWLLPAGLLASLALNVFLGSALVGRYTHDRARGEPWMLASLREFAERLPPSARETTRETLRARRAMLGAQRQELRDARFAVARALGAEPFDRAAAAGAFARLREATQAISVTTQEAIVDAAARLPVEARRELIERSPRSQRQPRP
ncbi:MAG: periplasmic heavy metal sensor [Alphaproteobacteria bacterium]